MKIKLSLFNQTAFDSFSLDGWEEQEAISLATKIISFKSLRKASRHYLMYNNDNNTNVYSINGVKKDRFFKAVTKAYKKH